MAEMQNPGLVPRASRDCFGGPSHVSTTSWHWREQVLASRFGLSPWMARSVLALLRGGLR
jgi:hypothetical protein